MRILKIITISLVVVALMGCSGYLFAKNKKLNKSYEASTQQVTQLQAKLDAVGTFADVYTVKANVGQGDEIKDADLILQTVPTSSVPVNVVSDKAAIIGKYFRIGFGPGQTVTTDLVMSEELTGAIYNRDVFLDSIPVGTKVGDYIDIRVVLPGGEELVAFPHKRINARYENATKLRFDEADLWIYTSMMVDKALYKSVGLKIYATAYNDPGADDKVVAYYPVRKEVIDMMNISQNITEEQRKNMWNESIRQSIDTKLKFYADALNQNSPKIAAGVAEEEGKYATAEQYYRAAIEAVTRNNELVDPNATGVTTDTTSDVITTPGTTPIGNLNTGGTQDTTTPQPAPATGTDAVNQSQDYLNNLPDDLASDDSPIE